jgi:hypothetical protein
MGKGADRQANCQKETPTACKLAMFCEGAAVKQLGLTTPRFAPELLRRVSRAALAKLACPSLYCLARCGAHESRLL